MDIRSLKYKWDNKNVLDYAVSEAKMEGKLEVARKLKKRGFSLQEISEDTGLPIAEIEKL